MNQTRRLMQLDVVIFGGGAAGLWLLDELVDRGQRVLLLEAGELGSGQTVVSQGIIHGGLKYTLQGLFTRSAESIREMPFIWRECLAGRRSPDLSETRVRSEFCYLWRTESLSSRLGMMGAKLGLRVAPKTLDTNEIPELLQRCPGSVARLDEQVIAPASFIANLAEPHRERILQIDCENGLQFECFSAGQIDAIHLTHPGSNRAGESQQLVLQAKHVVFTAGAGNAWLRRQAGMTEEAMQRRPLHMVMLRGNLPEFSGHCVDGAKTRVTITSDVDSEGRTVWQVGGQIAEEGVGMDPTELISQAARELADVLPGLDLSQAEWGTYTVDRAEGLTAGGKRPETIQILSDGNCITAWPTKLALAPALSQELISNLDLRDHDDGKSLEVPADWPRPPVARPPWETCSNWQNSEGLRATKQDARRDKL